MASPSARVRGPRCPCARLRGISTVGSIPAVNLAAINSRSAISELPLLARELQRRLHPLVIERDSRQNSGGDLLRRRGRVAAGYVWLWGGRTPRRRGSGWADQEKGIGKSAKPLDLGVTFELMPTLNPRLHRITAQRYVDCEIIAAFASEFEVGEAAVWRPPGGKPTA
jgi:hypothetical protein